MKKLLRIRCFYCDEKIVVDFYDMRKADTAHKVLADKGWILGVARADGDVLFDPLCHECGRGVVTQMLAEGGGQISPEAKKSLKKLYPELPFPGDN